MTVYHLSPKFNGEPRRCSARTPESCEYADNNNGQGVEHYNTKAEAMKAYEKNMAETHSVLPQKISKLGIRELSKLAKTTQDPQIFKEILERGSNQTLYNLLKNDDTPADILHEAYNKLDVSFGTGLSESFFKHPNFDVTRLKYTTDDYVTLAKSGYLSYDPNKYYRIREHKEIAKRFTEFLVSNNEVNSEIFHALLEKGHVSVVSKMIKNPNNKIKQEDYDNAVIHGRMPYSEKYSSERISEVPYEYLPETIAKASSPNIIDHAVTQALQQNNINKHKEEVILLDASTNENTSAYTIAKLIAAHDKIVSHPQDYSYTPWDRRGKETLRNLYYHKHNTAEGKKWLRENNPVVDRIVKLDELDKKYDGSVYNYIVKSNSSGYVHAYGRNRGYSEQEITMDKDKVKELGLEAIDVQEIVDRHGVETFGKYYPETGKWEGRRDSF